MLFGFIFPLRFSKLSSFVHTLFQSQTSPKSGKRRSGPDDRIWKTNIIQHILKLRNIPALTGIRAWTSVWMFEQEPLGSEIKSVNQTWKMSLKCVHECTRWCKYCSQYVLLQQQQWWIFPFANTITKSRTKAYEDQKAWIISTADS